MLTNEQIKERISHKMSDIVYVLGQIISCDDTEVLYSTDNFLEMIVATLYGEDFNPNNVIEDED